MHDKGNLAFSTRTRQQTFELLVVVTIESHSCTQMGWHLLREEPIALSPIDPEPFELMLMVDKTKSIAISKGCCSCHIE